MSPTLTDLQRQALHQANDAGPVTIVDPLTNQQYVLVRADVFEQMQEGSLTDIDPRATYPLVDRLLAADDEHDPILESYQRGMDSGTSR